MNPFAVKAVPVVSWSSHHPLNFQPRLGTLTLLSGGLVIFGIGEALLLAAGAGVSPWTVLAEGVNQSAGLSIGAATFLISVLVLLFWIPLKQTPGLGTLLNAVLIALAIDLSLPHLPVPGQLVGALLQTSMGILLVGLGSGLYLVAHLGPGPRDGLMTGLQRLTKLPIALVRTVLELSVVLLGWMLGGTVGPGTVMFALGIGPAVSLGLFMVARFSRA